MFLPKNIQRKFSLRAQKALRNAAISGAAQEIQPIHLLWAISAQAGSLAANLLKLSGLGSAAILKKTAAAGEAAVVGRPERDGSKAAPFSKQSRIVLEKAAAAAAQLKHKHVGTEHVLYALLKKGGLEEYFEKAALKKIEKRTKEILIGTNGFPDLACLAGPPHHSFSETSRRATRKSPRIAETDKELEEEYEQLKDEAEHKSALSYFCRDLTKLAKKGALDPLIGRQKELEQLIVILSRRAKNNPVLIGEPGVGKTALAQGLAQKIVRGEVPEHLADKKIFALDLGLLVAGAAFRGDFEARIKGVLQEAKEQNAILFIDELHAVVGAGAAQGSLDAANILKPALSNGEIQCIGATTFDEYKKYIEKDAALARRFQPLTIKEPSVEESVEILKGVKPLYEAHHNLAIDERALEAAVKLSARYINDRFLPDKAFDLLDEAAARVRRKHAAADSRTNVQELTRKLAETTDEKEKAVIREQFDAALKLKTEENRLRKEIARLNELRERFERRRAVVLTGADVAHAVAELTGIPAQEVGEEERGRLQRLIETLEEKIIGQHAALSEVASALKRNRAGLNHASRPLGSFLFLGPSGVGKTELAKALSETLTPDDDKNLIKINMSEYGEAHMVSRLIGAPPGYVGFEEAGELTEQIRRRPHSVVLFDEIEKAHPKIHNLLLQILEEGELTDAQGKKASFKNALITVTSNIGTAHSASWRIGFSPRQENKNGSDGIAEAYQRIKEETLKELKRRIKPELLNRFDRIVVFKPLGRTELVNIAALRLKELQQRADGQGNTLIIENAVSRLIGEKAFALSEGARPLRRLIEEMIENKLAEVIIERGASSGASWEVCVKNGKIIIK